MGDAKSSKKFHCELCDYKSSRKSQWDRHILTTKHKKETFGIHFGDNLVLQQTFNCICGNQYKCRQSLWKHKKKCCEKKSSESSTPETEQSELKILTNLVLDVVKQNQELTNKIVDICKTGQTNNISHSNFNSHNKTFNLNFFLNEECKNAINMSDFVNSIEFGLDDLEETGRLGFVEGISKVVIKNLTDLDINLRPIHCGDIKREVLYIKNDDKWEKDSKSKNIIKCAIQEIANKNIKKISEWIKCHPDCQNSESTQNTKYLNIVLNSMSGSTIEEQQSNYEKIITRVAKEVAIKKY
jgi:hypothetical protein